MAHIDMDCRQTQQKLPDLARGTLEGVEARAAQDHVTGCPECGLVLRQYQLLTLALEAARVPASAPLAAAVRSRVLAALAHEAAAALSPGRIALAVAAGLALVSLHAGVLHGRVDPAALSAAQLVAATAAGSALAIGACCWALGRFELRGIDLSAASLFALVTSGLGSVGILLCPEQTYFALWEGSRVSQALASGPGWWASYGAFGLLYGIPPALAASALLGSRVAHRGSDRGLVGAAAAVALWLPATYVQCADLPLWLLGIWTAGALAGVAAGAVGGLRLHRVLSPALGRPVR